MAGFTKTVEHVLHDPEMVSLLDAPIDYGFGGGKADALPVLKAEEMALRHIFSLVEAHFTPENREWHKAQPLVAAVKKKLAPCRLYMMNIPMLCIAIM